MTIIVALGDSTTAGTPGFRSPIEAPPDGEGDVTSQYAHWLMRARPAWRVLNRGVNGERSDQIAARFDRDVLAHRPAAVIIIAGVNDVYQGRPASHVIEHLFCRHPRRRRRSRRSRPPRLVARSAAPFARRVPRDGRGASARARRVGRGPGAALKSHRLADHARGLRGLRELRVPGRLAM